MALGDSYAIVAELEAKLSKTDDGTFVALLAAASRAVESFCRRQFNTDNAATARDFEASDSEFLPVDDFHTTTDLVIAIDGDPVALADVSLRPRAGIVDGQTGWPYFQIYAVDTTWPTWRWNRLAVTVTAQWGWAAVPAAVKLSTLDVATVMAYGLGSETSGPVRSESIDGYSASYATAGLGDLPDNQAPPELRKVIAYRRNRFGIA